ncbi:Short-chain dehydrogenase/reductase SDR (fragment) [groundwater metagenome]|uniref:Short-chain dehydrogenase/reductase SDR n=1 Tax=groundwater metagenome TaxID=717931 RepID=A0A098ECQ2_9ZZZZ
MEFKGKVALITGGNDGIGLSISKALLDKNYKVIIIDKNIHNATEINKENKNLYVFCCDICNEKEVTETFKKVWKITNTIDVLINSAGIGAFGNFDKMDIEIFRRVMDVNFFGTVRIIKECLPSMLKNENGHIINISSISGKVALPGSSAYCCSKWALYCSTAEIALFIEWYIVCCLRTRDLLFAYITVS